MTSVKITMHGIREPQPGPRWRALFAATWPAYRAFYLSEGVSARPSLRSAGAALASHMPELLPTWARLSEQTGFDDLASRMLTGWDLPRFAPAACSQVTTVDPGPALIRNYDYRPDLFEQVTISTDYLQPVIGTSDCLFGLLDGMNGSGLAVSLAYGGNPAYGRGFAISTVLRYVLETCASVDEARRVLARLPVSMVYNVTMIDTGGEILTAHLSPRAKPEFRSRPAATNHRWDAPVRPEHARRFGSVERLAFLHRLVRSTATSDDLAERMLSSPLRVEDYAHGFGTLYTAVYRLAERSLTYCWPGTTWRRTFDSADGTVDTVLADG